VTEKTVTVVIPVFNEERTIVEILTQVFRQELVTQIIVVDDASTDRTGEVIEPFRGHPKITLLRHEKNRGKGAALRTGFEKATSEFILIQDADLEYSPDDYPVLLGPLFSGKADVVFGSRFLGGPHRVLYFWHYLGNQFFTLLSNAVNNINLTDMEVGYKVFRREYLSRFTLTSDRFGFEPEITAKLAWLKVRMFEVPIQYYGRTYQEGKKITWKDGIAAIWWIFRFGFFR